MSFWEDIAKKTGLSVKLTNGTTLNPTGSATPLSATQAAPKTTTGGATPISSVAVKNNPNAPMSASVTGTTKANQTPSGGYIPPTVAPNMNQATTDYFAKHHGGIDAYTATQNERYAGALAANDTNLINALSADAARVGYALNTPKPAEVSTQALPSGGHMPQDAVTNVRNSSELKQQSGDSLAIERAAIKNAIDTQMASLKNNAAYADKLTNDGRVLQDFTRTQTVNPFSGKTSYDEGLIGRQRSIDDNSRNAELQTQLNSLDTEIANFDKLAPERQRQIYNELLQMERDFGLKVGDLTGTYGGKQTLGGRAQSLAESQFEWNKDPSNPSNVGQNLSNQGQQIANKFSQMQLDNYPESVKQQAQLFEQQLKSGKIDIATAEYQLKELTDPNSVTNQVSKLDLQMKELEAKNLPEMQRLQLQQLRKSISQIGKVAPTSEYDKQMQDIKLKTAQTEYENLLSQSNAPKGSKAEDYYSYIDSSPSAFNKDPYGESTQNNDIIESMILNSGLSPAEMTKLYNRYGIQMK